MRLGLLALLCACSSSPPRCASPEEILAVNGAQQATCADLASVRALIDVLVGEDQHDGLTVMLQNEGTAAFARSPEAYRRSVDWARASYAELSALTGLEAARRRSAIAHEVLYAATHDTSAFDQSYARFVRVWARDDALSLVLTERDVEGWIYLASLCAEVDGRSPLKVSIAARLQLYNAVTEHFLKGSAEEKIAIVSVGAFWEAARRRWQGATYEQQQAWIAEAPRPLEKLGTDMDYFNAVLATDLARQVQLLHAHFGPLSLNHSGL